MPSDTVARRPEPESKLDPSILRLAPRAEPKSKLDPSTPIDKVPALLTIADFATMSNVTPRTVRQWLADGIIKSRKFGHVVRIQRAELVRMWGTP